MASIRLTTSSRSYAIALSGFDSGITLETINYPPVGHCIYCGSDSYSATKKKLGREHIIPEALNGNHVLQDASCQACENSINQKIEQPLLRGYFQDARLRFTMRSKKNFKNRPKQKLVAFRKGGTTKMVEMPVLDAPFLLTMQNYETPGYFANDFTPDRHWRKPSFSKHLIASENLNKQIKDYDVDGIEDTCTREHFEIFPLFLAKIAHSLAWSDQDLFRKYEPCLGPLIIGKKSDIPISVFVGSPNGLLSPDQMEDGNFGDKGGHIAYPFAIETTHHGILAVYIRLFDNYHTPRYLVIVGFRPPQIKNTRLSPFDAIGRHS